MEKKKYYVSVQSNSILVEQGATPYEMEIYATEREVEQLQELLNGKWDADESTFIRGIIPAMPYHLDDENDNYDFYLLEIYKKLYELGTDETKDQIDKMNILNTSLTNKVHEPFNDTI